MSQAVPHDWSDSSSLGCEDLVVEAGEAPFVLRDEARLETALPIARHLDRERAIIGQHRLAAGPIAMIGGVLRLAATRG